MATQGAEEAKRRRCPAHETTPGLIRNMPSAGLEVLADWLRVTDFPAGHDPIIAAWKERGFDVYVDDVTVEEDLLAQKAEAEEKAAKKAEEKAANRVERHRMAEAEYIRESLRR